MAENEVPLQYVAYPRDPKFRGPSKLDRLEYLAEGYRLWTYGRWLGVMSELLMDVGGFTGSFNVFLISKLILAGVAAVTISTSFRQLAKGVRCRPIIGSLAGIVLAVLFVLIGVYVSKGAAFWTIVLILGLDRRIDKVIRGGFNEFGVTPGKRLSVEENKSAILALRERERTQALPELTFDRA